MKPLSGALVALLVLAGSPQPASARIELFQFINSSGFCAFVTIYHRNNGGSSQSATGLLRPRYVKPGESYGASADWDEVEVRADVSRFNYCTGSDTTAVYATYVDSGTV